MGTRAPKVRSVPVDSRRERIAFPVEYARAASRWTTVLGIEFHGLARIFTHEELFNSANEPLRVSHFGLKLPVPWSNTALFLYPSVTAQAATSPAKNNSLRKQISRPAQLADSHSFADVALCPNQLGQWGFSARALAEYARGIVVWWSAEPPGEANGHLGFFSGQLKLQEDF